MAMIYSHELLAEAEPQEAIESSQLAPAEQATMAWSLMPGESVGQLATLFYPRNISMQHLFVTKTLQLNRDVQPNLLASTSSSQSTAIVIPNIKLLAGQSSVKSTPLKNTEAKRISPRLQGNDGFKTPAVASVISPQMPLAYDELIKKNEFLKLELDKLNAQLTDLQQMLDTFKVELTRFLSTDLLALKSQSKPDLESQPKPELVSKQQPLAQAEPVKQKQDNAINNKPQNTTAESSAPVVAEKDASFNSQYLWMSILPLVLVISCFIGYIFYTRWQVKNQFSAVMGKFGFLGKKAFINQDAVAVASVPKVLKADSAVTPDEFTHSMPGADAGAPKVLHDKNEAELILEQAKIFVQIDRAAYAVRLLKIQIQAAPKTALHHWLYLLDIYRNTNQKEEFLQYARQLHQSFNVVAPSWDSTPTQIVIASSIEEFSHISAKVTKLWADCEKELKSITQTKNYLDELLTDNRDSERAGFSMEVFQEIMLLRDLLDVRDKLVNID
ncbi:MAG: hypothetical protein V4493_09815 [Pseudomonadota bacterium]